MKGINLKKQTHIIDSRSVFKGQAVRRRREDLKTGKRYTTYELLLHEDANVSKRMIINFIKIISENIQQNTNK